MGLLLLLYFVEDYRGRRLWSGYQQELVAQGERLEWTALIPAPIPDERNFAFNPLFKPVWHDSDLGRANPERRRGALPIDKIRIDHWSFTTKSYPDISPTTVASLAEWEKFYRGNTNYPQASSTATPAQWVITALSQYDESFQVLRQAAASRPECRYPWRYEDLQRVNVELLARLKQLVQTLRLRAVAHIGDQNPEAAFADIKLGLFLGDTLKTDALMICQLVRLSLHTIMQDAIREGWRQRVWADAQLEWFSQYFSAQNYLENHCRAFRCTRNMSIAMLEEFKQSRDPKLWWPFRWDSKPWLETASFRFGPAGWFDRNKYWIAHLYQDGGLAAVDPKLRRIHPTRVSTAIQSFQNNAGRPDSLFARHYTNSLPRLAEQVAFAQSMGNVTAICCAVDRYRRVGGRLPDSLEALVPRYLPALPHDVMTGQPFKYVRRGPDDYSVYGVGWDGKDDGGQYNGLSEKSDWGWPATVGSPMFHP